MVRRQEAAVVIGDGIGVLSKDALTLGAFAQLDVLTGDLLILIGACGAEVRLDVVHPADFVLQVSNLPVQKSNSSAGRFASRSAGW